MADDVIDALSKLKPAEPDRNAILFAAGRASAQHPAAWKWLACGLMATQLFTAALWMRPAPVPPSAESPPDPIAAESVESKPDSPPTPPEPYSYLALMWTEGEPERLPRFVPGEDRSEPPLTAGTRQFD